MACVMCGERAGFNRAIIDVLSGQEIGRLCRNCELTNFGRRLDMADAASENCIFCHRDGYYAAPQFESTIVEEGDQLVNKNEADVDDTTPQICDHHLEDMEQFDTERNQPDNSETIIRGEMIENE